MYAAASMAVVTNDFISVQVDGEQCSTVTAKLNPSREAKISLIGHFRLLYHAPGTGFPFVLDVVSIARIAPHLPFGFSIRIDFAGAAVTNIGCVSMGRLVEVTIPIPECRKGSQCTEIVQLNQSVPVRREYFAVLPNEPLRRCAVQRILDSHWSLGEIPQRLGGCSMLETEK